MRKDIFIDNNIAKNLTNPLSEEYRELKDWLIQFDEKNIDKCAVLVLSQKLIVEYISTSDFSYKQNISVIIELMRNQKRTNEFKNIEIKSFQDKYYTKKLKLRSNQKDQNHIPIVLMSDRKMAITLDKKFKYDLDNFPGFTTETAKKPSELDYK
ncbi:MAG: hypothetical protein H6578_08365 [Chitinophagales bacterium]|nr:hypothetical protein [Chitinophagales bacterium]